MHSLGDLVQLTPLAIAFDFAILLSAFALGLFGYIRKLGGWVFVGILVIIFGGIRLMPEDGCPIVMLGLVGVTLGGILGCFLFQSKVRSRRSTDTRGSRFANSYSGPSGFEDIDFDFNEQATKPPVASKDYYGTLGVLRTACFNDIKSAYRRELKKCHPDLFPGDKDKEAMAKELNEAYEVLGDDQKRAAFDRYGFVA